MTFGGGIPRANDEFPTHLCSIELEFNLSIKDHYVTWALLAGLIVHRSEAMTIAGNEINFMISYTYYWTEYLLGRLTMNQNKIIVHQSFDNLTLGNGETYGQWNCGVIYVLEGDVEYDILE